MNETTLLETLRTDPDNAAWLETLATAPETHGGTWPDEKAFEAFLDIANIPEEDRAILRDLLPVVANDPDLRWVIDRYVGLLLARLGQAGYEPMPELPEGVGDIRYHLFTFVHAIAMPVTLAFHRERGIPEEITRATMADIGRHYVIERDERRRSGLAGGHGWLAFHTRGVIYQLGRLQFEIANHGNRTSEAIREAGIPVQPGEPCLSIHIPGYAGGFPPDVCDASFAMAREFFPKHFPELELGIGVCHSWLLDPQLAEYLPESSNIVSFQRRFHQAREPEPGNEDTLGFVFRSPGANLDDLPQNTRLERAVVSHIRAGKQWALGHGWLLLADQG